MAGPSEPLLPPDLVARLGRLQLKARHRVSGRFAGAHASKRLGTSLDYADEREYLPGDDLRSIDVAASRRLGRLLVKLYEAEDEAAVRVVVDLSASMGFGAKAQVARQIATVLAFLAANAQDRVRVLVAGAGVSAGPWVRGPATLPTVSAQLTSAQVPAAVTVGDDGGPPGRPDLNGALRRAHGEGPRGPVVLVSDLLDEAWPEVLRALAAGRGDAVLVHLLGRGDLEPGQRGDLRLIDAETGVEVEVGIDDDVLAEHARVRDGWLADVEHTCGRHGIAYARLVDDEPIDGVVLGGLRSAGVVG